jgi:hypothetical protein
MQASIVPELPMKYVNMPISFSQQNSKANLNGIIAKAATATHGACLADYQLV